MTSSTAKYLCNDNQKTVLQTEGCSEGYVASSIHQCVKEVGSACTDTDKKEVLQENTYCKDKEVTLCKSLIIEGKYCEVAADKVTVVKECAENKFTVLDGTKCEAALAADAECDPAKHTVQHLPEDKYCKAADNAVTDCDENKFTVLDGSECVAKLAVEDECKMTTKHTLKHLPEQSYCNTENKVAECKDEVKDNGTKCEKPSAATSTFVSSVSALTVILLACWQTFSDQRD